MSLDLPQLLPQVQQLSQVLSQRQARQLEALSEATRSYHALATLPLPELEERISLAGSRWTGARAPGEGFSPSIAPPGDVPDLVVCGADGSQIYPDRHAAAAFYLVNIAAIRLQHDQPEAPQTYTKTKLYFEDEQLRYESGQPIGNPWVSLQRDVGEMRVLAEICQADADRTGLALLDNSLLLWMVLQAHSAGEEALDRCLKDYLESMNSIHDTGQALAGIIDRPRSQNVLALAQIATLPRAVLEAGEIPSVRFDGLSDSQLFSTLLPPGHRSPCFGLISPLNRDFEAAGQGVHFFYLHSAQGQILRVEVPGWVARSQALLARVHAGVLRECGTTGGYPYVLVRAHELALVTQAEGRLLEDWIGRALAGTGVSTLSSQKAWMKTRTASPGL
jgi:hypothetical protein